MARRRDPVGDDARYLALRRQGLTYREIANLKGVSYRTVLNGVAAARRREVAPKPRPKREPEAVLIFGASCKPLKLLTCDDVHPRGPIPDGSRCVCASCHKSGIDDHPALKRDPRTDPKPDPKPKSKKKTQTRKQRRKEQYRGGLASSRV